MPVSEPTFDVDSQELHVSPLQVALAAAAFSNHGSIPAPRIATAVDTPNSGWVVLPALGTPFEAISASKRMQRQQSLIVDGQSFWSQIGEAESEESPVTWFMGGTPPNWQATPMVVVVLLEEDNSAAGRSDRQQLLMAAMNP